MLNIKVEKLLENIPEAQDVNERLKDTATKVETIGDRLKSQSVLVKHSQRTIELADRFRTISSYFDKIEELKDLWTFGVRTYDSLTGQFFQLYAALLWTINDFPAYGDLSGWSTKGYQACPICMSDRLSFELRGKISFMGHRRYLPKNHVWRRSRLHDGKVERKAPPVVMNGDEILEQLDQLEFPVMSKHPSIQDKKRKRALNWTKRSIFFKLSY